MLEARLPEGADVGALLGDLQAEYAERGVNLVRVAGGWSFRTAPDLAAKLRIETTVPRKLSRAAVETLAILAYHQPATRTDVEQIRGVMISKGTFDTLMEAGWIHPVGRKNTPGRPVTWGTTETFLKHFGLNSLQDLPGVDELKATGLLDPRPASVVVQGMPGVVPPRTEEDTTLPEDDVSDDEPEPLAPEAH
jgi:segregation and condensation protein B